MHLKKNNLNLILIYTIFTLLISVNLANYNFQQIKNYSGTNINGLLSTDPNNPTSLSDDITIIEDYSASNFYYYDTYTIYSNDYLLIWIKSIDSEDNFDLYLYGNDEYTNLIESSAYTGHCDWIVYRPTSAQITYPMILADDDGDAVIGASTASNGSVSHSYPVLLQLEYGCIYQINLTARTPYTAAVQPWPDMDLDLFVYYLNSGEYGNCGDYKYFSANNSTGTSESITFTPSTDGTYAFVIIKKCGTNNGSFIVSEGVPIPGFEFIQILFGIITALAISLIFYRKLNVKNYKI